MSTENSAPLADVLQTFLLQFTQTLESHQGETRKNFAQIHSDLKQLSDEVNNLSKIVAKNQKIVNDLLLNNGKEDEELKRKGPSKQRVEPLEVQPKPQTQNSQKILAGPKEEPEEPKTPAGKPRANQSERTPKFREKEKREPEESLDESGSLISHSDSMKKRRPSAGASERDDRRRLSSLPIAGAMHSPDSSRVLNKKDRERPPKKPNPDQAEAVPDPPNQGSPEALKKQDSSEKVKDSQRDPNIPTIREDSVEAIFGSGDQTPKGIEGKRNRKDRSVRVLEWPREPEMIKLFEDERSKFTGEEVSEEEAFQQAWMELENLRQKKISSLGQKDLEKLFMLTKSKLREKTPQETQSPPHETSQQTEDPTQIVPKKKKKKKKFEVEPTYKGPHLGATLQESDLDILIAAFTDQTQLHYKYAFQLVSDAKNILDKDPNIMEFNPTPNGHIVVVGDLHGQLFDLMTILRRTGLPSAKNIMIFNGDFVDRGPQGAEVLFLLFCLKLLFPSYVCLVRGNHEDKRINQKYNFETEIRNKYDGKMFNHITDSFKYLALGAVIGGTIFVVHGGLPQLDSPFLLQEVRDMNRKIELPKPEACLSRQEKILEGLLWSDPTETVTHYEESKRGCGTQWGKMVTKEFLQNNNLSLLVRSHQLCDTGHKYNHYKHVITIFSCSYYCGINNNKGAYMIFDSDLNHKFIEYTAEIHTDNKNSDSLTDRSTLAKTEALQKIRSRIYDKRRKLWEIFVTYDEEKTGLITKAQWIKGMTKVLKLPIIWAKIYPYLVTPNAEGKINYQEFLDRYRVEYGDESSRVFRQLRKNFVDSIRSSEVASLQGAFNNLSPNAEGFVTYQQADSYLRNLLPNASRTHLYDFVRRLDINKDGQIDFGDFEGTLKSTFNQTVGSEDIPWLFTTINSIGKACGGSEGLQQAWQKYCHKKTQTMSFVAWTKFLTELHFTELTEDEKHKLFSHLKSASSPTDVTGVPASDVLTFDDLEIAFFGQDFFESDSQKALSEEVWSLFIQKEDTLRDLFRLLDPDASNKLTTREFTAAIETFNETFKKPLTPLQIVQVVSVAPRPENDPNKINYESFLKQFHVVMIEK